LGLWTGADKGTAGTTIGAGVPTQRESESAVSKSDPAENEDATGGRDRNIKQSPEPLSLTQESREKPKSIFRGNGTVKREKANFEMMIVRPFRAKQNWPFCPQKRLKFQTAVGVISI
jgi:hypothetical protein